MTKKQDNINRVSKMLAHALTLGTEEACWQLAAVAHVRLKPADRARAICSFYWSLDADQRGFFLDTVAKQGAGQPMPPLLSAMDQAAFWTDGASEDEKKAYCLATYNAMSEENRCAFRSYVWEGIAA
ncbi:hypothetical protein [Psychromarinibacter sp. S121]|uniref:hypothetical protein n=1 Tax=Psychromarinibacter sp. S121 TaxID=3415127 RepID=UPI003C79C37D